MLERVSEQILRLDRISWIKFGLLALFIVGTNVSVWSHLTDIAASGMWHRLIIFLMIWMMVLASCVVIAWHPSQRVRIGWGLPIVIAAFISGAFVAIVGNPMSFADILMYWAMRADASDALYSFWSGMILPLIMAICGLAAIFLKPTQSPFRALIPSNLAPSEKTFRLRLASAFPLIPFLAIIIATYGIGGRFTATFPVQFKSLTLLSLTLAEALIHDVPARDKLDIQTTRAPSIKHILMIVDESIAGDFIDLNNNLGTTPILTEQRNIIANFGYASSTHNCSDQSNALLRWGVGPHNFEDAFTHPTIWQYAQKAGFQTVYIDVQKREGMLQNYMNEQEKHFIDEFIQYNDVSTAEKSREFVEKDLRAAEHVQELLKRDTPQFIYVVKEGLHFPFEGKYPEDESHFSNHMSLLEPIGTSRERLVNSYKNGVRWAANKFFEILLKDIDLENTLILYTSDHGQNLMDQGLPTHCRAVDAHYTEGLIPLFAMTSEQNLLMRFKQGVKQNKNNAAHGNIFPTLIEVFGYDSSSSTKDYQSTLFDPITAEQGFASGFVLDSRSEWKWNPLPTKIVPREATQDQLATQP